MSELRFTNFQVQRGVLRIPASFTGAKDGTFSRKNEFLRPGDAIPEGMLSDREMRKLTAEGIIVEIATPAVAQAAQVQAQKHMSRWAIDPATLGDKELEDLLVMVQEIDPQYPLDDLDEDGARRLLSKDFDPDMDRPITPQVVAGDPVSRLTHDGAKDAGASPLSPGASEALAELQARAETPDAAGDADGDSAVVEDSADTQEQPQG